MIRYFLAVIVILGVTAATALGQQQVPASVPTPFPPTLQPVSPAAGTGTTTAQNQRAVQQQSQESLLYGVAAGGQGAQSNTIYRAGQQSREAAPQPGNPDLLTGVAVANQEKNQVAPASANYTVNGRTAGRAHTSGGTTNVYGAGGQPVGRIEEHGNTTTTYGAGGRATGRVQKSGGNSVIYGADGRSTGRINESGNTTNLYGADGKSIGRTQSSGNTTNLYDQKGQTSGRVVKRGNTTYFYGPDGRVTGRQEKRGNTTYFYDASGRQTGTSRE